MLTVQDKIDILKVNMYVIDADPEKVFAYDDSNRSPFYCSHVVGYGPLAYVIERVVDSAYNHFLENNTCN